MNQRQKQQTRNKPWETATGWGWYGSEGQPRAEECQVPRFTGELLYQPAQRDGHAAAPAQGKRRTRGYGRAEGLARVGSGEQQAPVAWLAPHLLRLEGYSGTWALEESST